MLISGLGRPVAWIVFVRNTVNGHSAREGFDTDQQIRLDFDGRSKCWIISFTHADFVRRFYQDDSLPQPFPFYSRFRLYVAHSLGFPRMETACLVGATFKLAEEAKLKWFPRAQTSI